MRESCEFGFIEKLFKVDLDLLGSSNLYSFCFSIKLLLLKNFL